MNVWLETIKTDNTPSKNIFETAWTQFCTWLYFIFVDGVSSGLFSVDLIFGYLNYLIQSLSPEKSWKYFLWQLEEVYPILVWSMFQIVFSVDS